MAKNQEERFLHAPTFEQAKELLKEQYSCLVEEVCSEHIVLSPCYIGKLRKGVEEQLDKRLMLYSESSFGVLLAYERTSLQLVQREGSIFDEDPLIHFDIKVNCIVFRPAVNCLLAGDVSKVAYDHIGLHVHGCFNASIPRNRSNMEGWTGDNLRVGERFVFRVNGVEAVDGVLVIAGNVDKSTLTKSLKRKISSTKDSALNNSLEEPNDIVNKNATNSSPEVEYVPKKKKKIEILLVDDEKSPSKNINVDNIPFELKRKDRNKRRDESNVDLQNSNNLVNGAKELKIKVEMLSDDSIIKKRNKQHDNSEKKKSKVKIKKVVDSDKKKSEVKIEKEVDSYPNGTLNITESSSHSEIRNRKHKGKVKKEKHSERTLQSGIDSNQNLY